MLVTLYRLLGLHSLKQRIRCWIGFTIVLLGLMILASTYMVEAYNKTSETNRQIKETIGLQRLFIERWIEENFSQIRYLSKVISETVTAGDKEEMSKLFASFISSQDDFASVAYVDQTGKTVVNSDGAPNVDVSDREYYKAAKNGREFVTSILIGRITGKPIVIFSSPLSDDAGRFNGVVLGTISIGTLERMMSQFDLGRSGEAYLLDRNGQFLTKPRGFDAAILSERNESSIVSRALKREPPEASYANYRGEQVLGQYAWTKENQWLIVAEINRNAVFQSLYRNMLLMVGIVLTVLILSTILIVSVTRHIERPIRFLLVGTKIMRDGNYDYRIAKEEIDSAPVELQQLCDTFNATAQKLKSTIQLLEQTAVVDQLTEVYNRRFMMKEGSKLLEACIRAQQPCSVLMIDIDLFKKVNDTYGHLVGDRVIMNTASILMDCVRSCDLVSRYGGEEFLILAPNTEAEPGGVQLGERIRQYFVDHPYREEGIEIPLTVSIGVADYRDQPGYRITALEDMISRADAALYQAKHNGRNRVEASDGSD